MTIKFAALLALIGVAATTAQKAPPDVRPADAVYLQKATANIEAYRKGDAEIDLVGPDGAPVQNAAVAADQVRQEFLFGCILFPLTSPGMSGESTRMTSEEQKLFEEPCPAVFNFRVLPFYWASYERTPGMTNWREPEVGALVQAEGITAKGHPLVWADTAGIPKWLAGLPKDLHEDMLKARVINTMEGFAGAIDSGTW